MAKGIRSVWIDSDTPESLGNKVIRDEVEIATVPNGVQEYKDPDVVVNREYKYVIQSYTATGQSTDEVLGDNLNYYTIVEASGLTPIMTNFRVDEDTPTHVHFDTPLGPVTGASILGFVISGKNITGLDTANNYFTVDSPFDFWDNNTVRLGENTDTDNIQSALYNFTLDYIDNNIPEPESTRNMFVSANGSGDGTTEGSAASISFAYQNCLPGDTWWCKAGDYGNQQFDFERDGTDTDPIKFIGYKTDWTNGGDITTNYWDNTITWDANEMPTFTGVGSGIAMDMNGSHYVIWRNFQYDNFSSNINGNEINSNLIYHRVNINRPGSSCVLFASGASSSSRWVGNNNIRLIDCVGRDSDMINFQLFGEGSCLIENVKSYGNLSPRTDYQIAFNGDNNICRRSFAGNTDTGNESHGIGIRGSYNMTNQWNLIELCETNNCIEGLYFRNYGTNNNVIKNCIVNDTVNSSINVEMNGLAFMNYVSDNIFENITVKNQGRAVLFSVNNGEDDNEQGGSWPGQLDIGPGNKLRNVIADGCLIGFGGFNTQVPNIAELPDVTAENCTLIGGANAGLVYMGDFNVTGWKFKNCIIENWIGYGGTSPVMSYNNGVEISDRAEIAIDYARYFGNKSGWAPNGGADNVSLDTQLDASYVPQADFDLIKTPRLYGVERDYNYDERELPDTTVGAYKSTSEEGGGGTPPIGEYDYYVSEDGTGDGSSDSTPMSFAESQTAINSMTAGQSIAYKGGDEFFGQLTLTGKSGITITSYGTGKAIIKGSKDITDFDNGGSGNIWSGSTGVDDALQVFKGGANLLNARMPKIAAKETPSNSYYNVTEIYGVNKTRFLSTDLIGLGLSIGSIVTISSRQWALESREITAFNNSTGEVTFTPDAKYDIELGANFYVNNDEVLLTEQDEWRYDSNTLYMYSTSQPTGISISTVDGDAITITNSDNITLDDIAIKDFNNNAFEVDSSDNLTLNNLELDYNYMQAANVVNSTNFTMTNCTVTGSNQEIITIDGTSHDANIVGNEFIDCGVLKNITSKDVYQPNGIYSAGDRLNLELNTYRNIGYLGVFWIGADSTITKNIFEDYCQALEDGGGVYSHNGDWANVGATGSVASNNMCISTAFTDGWLSHGLYTDERCHDIIFRDNTVINGRYGAYLHNNKRIEHDGNNFYNQDDYGIHIKEDDNGGEGETVDNSIHDNYIFEIDPVVECAFYRSSYDIPSSGIFGTYNNNAYWNPRYSSLDTIVLANSATQFLTLSEWQGLSGQDLNSTTNPSLWTGSEQSQIVYNATNEVVVKVLTGTWYDLDGTQYVNEITLQPFTSSILISEEV